MKIGNSIAAALVLLFVTHSAHALDPSQPANSYIRTRFGTDEGLESQVVNNLVQTPDGFLWISTGGGDLIRFDGKNFTRLLFDRVGPLTLGPNGDLWVATTNGLSKIPPTTFSQ